MATILEFRVTKSDGEKQTPPARSLGEIIIFPGVRIERHGPHQRLRRADDDQPSAETRVESRV